MKKLFAISALVCALITIAHAQESSDTKPRRMGGGGFTIGYGNMGVSALHAFVPDNVKKFKNDQLVIGGTGHGFIGNLVIGGSGFGVIGEGVATDTLKISLGGGVGTFDIGYLAVNKDKLKIFPMLGIGGGGYGISIAKHKNLSVADIQKNPGQEIHVGKGGFLVDLSVNLHFIPVLSYEEEDNSYGGFMTGLKVGYIYSLPTSDWNFTGGDINGGPNFNMNMFYVKLIIGGFGYNKVK